MGVLLAWILVSAVIFEENIFITGINFNLSFLEFCCIKQELCSQRRLYQSWMGAELIRAEKKAGSSLIF